jgi:hypothetical protein
MTLNSSFVTSGCDTGAPFSGQFRDFYEQIANADQIACGEQAVVERGANQGAQCAERHGPAQEHQRDQRATRRLRALG